MVIPRLPTRQEQVVDANASWTDYVDGNATITATGTVDITTLGTYVLSYDHTLSLIHI